MKIQKANVRLLIVPLATLVPAAHARLPVMPQALHTPVFAHTRFRTQFAVKAGLADAGVLP